MSPGSAVAAGGSEPDPTPPQRRFHFVFGLQPQVAPFHLLHYLCLASCLAVNQPDVVRFHYRNEPIGPLWERIRPRLDLVRITEPVADWRQERYAESHEGRLITGLGLGYAHEADFIRMDALIREGGCYADMDTLFVRPYPQAWFRAPFAIGEENATHRPGEVIAPSLCNAVMFAQPGSRFAVAWRQRMVQAFDGSWSAHSCREAARCWRDLPDAVSVLPTAYFYRYAASVSGLRALLEENDRDHDDLFSIHLWAHLWWAASRGDFSSVHAGQIDAAWIERGETTLARLARPHLPRG